MRPVAGALLIIGTVANISMFLFITNTEVYKNIEITFVEHDPCKE